MRWPWVYSWGPRSLPPPPSVCRASASLHPPNTRRLCSAGRGHPSGSEGVPPAVSPRGLPASFPLIPLSFWDWEKGEKLDYFHNGNPRYTRVTAMEYLNGQDCSLLLTATGEWGPRGRRPGLGRRGGRDGHATPAVSSGRGDGSSGKAAVTQGPGRLRGKAPPQVAGQSRVTSACHCPATLSPPLTGRLCQPQPLSSW